MKKSNLWKRFFNLFLGLWTEPIKVTGTDDKQRNTLVKSNDVIQKIVLNKKKKPQDADGGMASKERAIGNDRLTTKGENTSSIDTTHKVTLERHQACLSVLQKTRNDKPKISLRPKQKPKSPEAEMER